jgi:hypothetical protein
LVHVPPGQSIFFVLHVPPTVPRTTIEYRHKLGAQLSLIGALLTPRSEKRKVTLPGHLEEPFLKIGMKSRFLYSFIELIEILIFVLNDVYIVYSPLYRVINN